MPMPMDTSNSASGPLHETPFFLTLGDDGFVKRLYMFANETLQSRNFKRSVISFLSFARPSVQQGDNTFVAVDQLEHGVYGWRFASRTPRSLVLTVSKRVLCVQVYCPLQRHGASLRDTNSPQTGLAPHGTRCWHRRAPGEHRATCAFCSHVRHAWDLQRCQVYPHQCV